MCGITGIFNFNKDNKINSVLLQNMNDSLAHRGPDGEGFFIDNNIGLGHRRLEIIDLKTGDQPMHSFDKNIVVVFNGEIYNYLELKKALVAKGHKFRTNSDTEVILAAYEKWGKDCVNYFRGMFAFALYDSKNDLVFCARDRFGIKPFYFLKNKKRKWYQFFRKSNEVALSYFK